MHSMKNAAELRERAEQSQKQQQDEIRATGSAAEPASEEKAGEHAPQTEDTTCEGSGAGVESSTAEEKQELAEGAAAEEHAGGEAELEMSEETVDQFFRVTLEKLNSPEVRESIKQKVTPELRIPALLLEVQNMQLEAMGIDKLAGKAALNQFARTTAMEKKEAHDKMTQFTQACQRTYIELLREMEPAEADGESKLTPTQMMEFFEACDTLMALQETKDELRKEFLETKKPPDETIVGMQRKMFRTLGVDPEHGVTCIRSFATDYPDDDRLKQRSQEFMRCATMARQEAVLGKEEMTKRLHMQQVAAMRQQKMALELQALSAAERDALAKRVEEMQKKHALAIQTLSTPEERAAYVKGIPEEEQWEIAKLQMMRMQAMTCSNGAHSHGEHSHDHHHHDHHGAHGHHHSAHADEEDNEAEDCGAHAPSS